MGEESKGRRKRRKDRKLALWIDSLKLLRSENEMVSREDIFIIMRNEQSNVPYLERIIYPVINMFCAVYRDFENVLKSM